MQKKENYILHFLKSTGLLLTGVVLPKVVVFLLLSFNTSHIGTADYGYYDLSVNVSTLLSYLLFFDIWITTMRYLCDPSYENSKVQILCGGNKIFLLSAALYAVIGIIFCIAVRPAYGYDVILLALMQNLANMYTFSARGLERETDFAVSGIISSIVLGLLNICLILFAGWGIRALYWSAISGYLVQCIYLEIRCHYLKAILSSAPDAEITKSMFRFTLPMGAGALAFWVLNSFDKIVLTYATDLESGGIYAVAERLAGMITFAVQCFTYAWQDIAFRHESDDEGSFYSLATKLYVLFLSAGIALILPGIRIIFPFFIGKDYSQASGVIPVAIAAAAISGLSLFLNNIFYALHETRAGTKLSLLSCVFNLAICYPCIKCFGLAGASIAIFLSFCLDSLLKGLSLSGKIGYRIPWDAFGISAVLVCLSCLIYFRGTVLINCLWLAAGITVCGIIAFRYIFKK